MLVWCTFGVDLAARDRAETCCLRRHPSRPSRVAGVAQESEKLAMLSTELRNQNAPKAIRSKSRLMGVGVETTNGNSMGTKKF